VNDSTKPSRAHPDTSHLSDDQLSELIDLQPSGRELEEAVQIEHLNSCPECQERLDNLRATIALFRDLPEREPPRSYRLPAQEVEAPSRKPATPFERLKGWFTTGAPAFRLATTAVAILLLSVTAVDFWVERDQPADEPVVERAITLEDAAPAPTLEAADEMQPPADAAVEADAEDTSIFSIAEEEETADEAPLVLATPPAAEPVLIETDITEEGRSIWRTVQFGLLILLGWLVVTWIGYERTMKSRSTKDSS
jgi:hypothetical protein